MEGRGSSTTVQTIPRKSLQDLCNALEEEVSLAAEGEELTEAELKHLKQSFQRILFKASTHVPTAPSSGLAAATTATILGGLQNRVAVVTAAAQGIGQAICISLAKQGARVVCCDLASNPATGTAEMINRGWSSSGDDIRAISLDCDATDRAAVDDMFKEAISRMGAPVEIAVSVVGGGDRVGFLEETVESYLKSVELTQHTHWHFQQSAARGMVSNGVIGGQCVLIGSIMSALSVKNASTYQMAKSSLPTLTKCIANELAPHIRVNLVQPGYIDTPGELRWATTEVMHEKSKNIPLKRMGKGSDIGDAVAFLCSDMASYITGTTLNVDGGYLTAIQLH